MNRSGRLLILISDKQKHRAAGKMVTVSGLPRCARNNKVSVQQREILLGNNAASWYLTRFSSSVSKPS